MPAAWLYHVTLDTGHVRWSPRDEVGDGVIAALRPMVSRPGIYPIPGTMAGLAVDSLSRHALRARVLLMPLADDAEVLVTIGAATHSRSGAALWRQLHARPRAGLAEYEPPLATLAEQRPPAPWCAARLERAYYYERAAREIASGAPPGDATWLGDFERCLAWAFVSTVR